MARALAEEHAYACLYIIEHLTYACANGDSYFLEECLRLRVIHVEI